MAHVLTVNGVRTWLAASKRAAPNYHADHLGQCLHIFNVPASLKEVQLGNNSAVEITRDEFVFYGLEKVGRLLPRCSRLYPEH